MADQDFFSSVEGMKSLKIPVNKRQQLKQLHIDSTLERTRTCQTEIHTTSVAFDHVGVLENEINHHFDGIDSEAKLGPVRRDPQLQFDQVDYPIVTDQSKNKDAEHVGEYTNWDVLINVASILFYVADFVFDSLLAISYYRESRYVFFGLTLAFMTVPSIVMNIISLFWYVGDYESYQGWKKIRSVLHVLASIFQLAPILRYASAIHYGLKSRRTGDSPMRRSYYFTLSLEEDKDSCMLRLFEAALEAGPQLILQLYILLTQPPQFKDNDFQMFLQFGSIFLSWFGMSWAHLAYHRALRFSRTDKDNMTICASFWYFLWRVFEVGPRVVALAAFAEVLTKWVFVVTGIHWVMMTCWYGFQRIYEKPMFGTEWRYLDHAFNMVCAAVSIFGFLNVKEGHTRYRCVVYYILYYIENVFMMATWFGRTKNRNEWYYIPAFTIVVVGFYLCIGAQLLYYLYFHPSAKIKCCLEKEDFFQSICFTPKLKSRQPRKKGGKKGSKKGDRNISKTSDRSNHDGLLNSSSVELVTFKTAATSV